jgi:ubiquinone/menaquinone biosynthesis C-methylase UbiE
MAIPKKISDEKTSWKPVSEWYDSLVGEKGHFYHREVILPNVLRLLHLSEKDRLLDICCGQGVLSRAIPKKVEYVGIDIARPLLNSAARYHSPEHHTFIEADITRPWPLSQQKSFSHAACILALQNIEDPATVFIELAKVLHDGARAVFVLNHPYFRIPRQSRWNFDEKSKTQTRELFSYMTPRRIPIVMHPGKHTTTTWSFHVPLSFYTSISHESGFVIETIEEWCSPKHSTGAAAKSENRARKEFPLFMAIVFQRYTRSVSTESKSQRHLS